MDLLQLFYYLRQYNADIIVIGGIVAAACYFLGRLLRGKISEKFIVFLPFLLGAALLAMSVDDAAKFIGAGFLVFSLAFLLLARPGRGKGAEDA